MVPSISDNKCVSNAKLSYKYQRLRERLRQAVETGDLSGKLPGERELARRYQANAKTVNKALNDLALEGLLVRHIGRGTFVAGGDPATAPLGNKPRNFAWLIPVGGNHAHLRGMFDRAAETLRQQGHRLTQLTVPTDASGRLVGNALGPGTLRTLDGAILFSSRPSRELLADLRRRHVPVVIANNHDEHIKTPVVLPDYSHGAFLLCEHLVQLGHAQVQLLLSPELLPAAMAAGIGYRAAMDRHGLRRREVVEVKEGFDWAGLLNRTDRPTALICVGGHLTVEASSRAVEAGFVQPAMLSISSLPEPGETLMAERCLTAYEVEPGPIVYWATQLLLSASAGQVPEMVIVPGRVVDRGSAVPPPGGGRPITECLQQVVI